MEHHLMGLPILQQQIGELPGQLQSAELEKVLMVLLT